MDVSQNSLTYKKQELSHYKIIFITGGIGVGKSSVLKWFANKGFPVISADDVSRQVILNSSEVIRSIYNLFGDECVDIETLQIKPAALRHKISSDPKHKKQLEALLHPLIFYRLVEVIKQNPCEKPIIIEVPILDSDFGFEHIADHILWIDADPKVQVERVMLRDLVNEKSALAMLDIQTSRTVFKDKSDYYIYNDGSENDFSKKLETWWNELYPTLSDLE
ncbi:MAG: dephospho-CoA kinase [Pseudomonadota bacterium]